MDKAASSASALGALVAKKAPSRAYGAAGLLFGLAAVAGGVMLIARREWSFGGVVLLFGLAMAGGGLWASTQVYEIFENGVRGRSLFGNREIRFNALRTFSYSQVRRGAETNLNMILVPAAGKPFRITAKAAFRKTDDDDLRALSDRLSAMFAAKMEEALNRRGRVDWIRPVKGSIPAIPSLLITKDGFVIDDGKAQANLIRGEVRPEINNGQFILRRAQDSKPAYVCPTSHPNFYPGLALLNRVQGPSA